MTPSVWADIVPPAELAEFVSAPYPAPEPDQRPMFGPAVFAGEEYGA